MLLNSSSVQKQNYSLRVLRNTLTPSIGGAHLRFRTFPLVNKSNHAFSEEVKRIQQLEENGGWCSEKRASSDLLGEATTTTTATIYRTTHTSHLDKRGHEVGPQCGE